MERRGWAESGGRRFAVLVADFEFDYDGNHKAVCVCDNTIVIEAACCVGSVVDQVEAELGQSVDRFEWSDN